MGTITVRSNWSAPSPEEPNRARQRPRSNIVGGKAKATGLAEMGQQAQGLNKAPRKDRGDNPPLLWIKGWDQGGTQKNLGLDSASIT